MIIPIILSGGSGTRLWPMSRELYPKQLLPLLQDRSLLQHTVERIAYSPQIQQPIIICNEDHRFLVAEQLRNIISQPAQIILEPTGRNTAPAIAIAALQAQMQQTDPILLVLPADHLLPDKILFNEAILAAKAIAEQNMLVTFGITPTKAETAYGYIKAGQAFDYLPNNYTAYQVSQFIEKPELAIAQQYIEEGGYYWNSGMFMFRASVILKALQCYAPDILQACQQTFNNKQIDQDFIRLDKTAFTACRSESIDYAVMEKTQQAVVIPLQTKWNDVGSWSALWEVSEQDAEGNVTQGDVIIEQTKNCYLHATNRMIAVIGMADCIVMETADAVLVANKADSQDVKKIVARMKQAGRSEVELHRTIYRPWGSYEILDDNKNFKVKRIHVAPGASLSLQMHHRRAEHWVVVSGIAEVTCGEKIFELHENQSTYIPMGTKHRLRNLTPNLLIIIEVQSGDYLGEDDIVRYADVYGR